MAEKLVEDAANRASGLTQIDNNTLSHLLLCSFRYSLGRMTYITSDCEEWLRRYWHLLPFGWRTQIHADIRQAIERGHAGHQCDIDSWKKVLELPLGDAA
jgi:hypothetical protein